MSEKATEVKRSRSPNYPAIGLGEAIDRVRKVYQEQQTYPATRETMAKLLGYKGLSGASITVLSALSKYGLLTGHGDSLRVSEVGQDLALHQKSDIEFLRALEVASTNPAFFREMNETYPSGLPNELSVKAALAKKGFSLGAIDGAIQAYRETQTLLQDVSALAANPKIESESDSAQDLLLEPSRKVVSGDQRHGQEPFNIPLSVDKRATLYASFPLTKPEWRQLLKVLEVYEQVLTVNDADLDE